MNIPEDLGELVLAMVRDIPTILSGNLVGIYLWGSLTYDAFDERCSDADCVAVTRRDLDEREFAELSEWFIIERQRNRWVSRLDLRFVIEHEELDKNSRCCGFYPYTGKLVRHGSDGNPIIWINVAQSGVTLWGKDAKLVAPHVSEGCLSDALLLELNYLKNDLMSNAGDRSDKAFIHNAYAVLTACRIFFSAHHKAMVSKDRACEWAIKTVPPEWRSVIETARENRLKNGGSTDPRLELDAVQFVEFVMSEVKHAIGA